MDAIKALSTQQQSIIPIAAFTASGNLEKLKSALHAGLDAGLTVNEIKEILVHLYAYTGFPRSLNALTTFMAVMNERQAQVIEDEVGKEASPVPADLNKDAYGAKVRAQLAGWETLRIVDGHTVRGSRHGHLVGGGQAGIIIRTGPADHMPACAWVGRQLHDLTTHVLTCQTAYRVCRRGHRVTPRAAVAQGQGVARRIADLIVDVHRVIHCGHRHLVTDAT